MESEDAVPAARAARDSAGRFTNQTVGRFARSPGAQELCTAALGEILHLGALTDPTLTPAQNTVRHAASSPLPVGSVCVQPRSVAPAAAAAAVAQDSARRLRP